MRPCVGVRCQTCVSGMSLRSDHGVIQRCSMRRVPAGRLNGAQLLTHS